MDRFALFGCTHVSPKKRASIVAVSITYDPNLWNEPVMKLRAICSIL
jgi:hypothetical protein